MNCGVAYPTFLFGFIGSTVAPACLAPSSSALTAFA